MALGPGGSPFYVGAIAEVLRRALDGDTDVVQVDRGLLVPWAFTDEEGVATLPPLPATATALARARIDGLVPDAQLVLKAASAFQGGIPLGQIFPSLFLCIVADI